MTSLADQHRQVFPAPGRERSRPGSPLTRRIMLTSGLGAQALVLAILLLDPLPAQLRFPAAGLFGLAGGLALTGVHVAHLVLPLRALAAALGSEGNSHFRSPQATFSRLLVRDDEIGRICAGLDRTVRSSAERAEACEAFASDLVHEIRNPLASLRSATTSLKVAQGQQRAELLAVIDQDVARLERLVSEMSKASRLQAELLREEAAAFDVVGMVRAVVDLVHSDAARLGVDLIADLPFEQAMISGRDARLAQVLVNLLDNAISFCERGDAIRVCVRVRDEKVAIVVEDTGPGIPEGAAEKIFGRFYTHRPAEHFGENSGLGLAISRQIVEAHDGFIWAENIRPTSKDPLSEPSGARFFVVLPR